MARKLIFVTGGVRSGKSSFAEELAVHTASITGGPLHYIAAGQASDDEMLFRIKRHQKDRDESGFNWTTWEKPTALHELSESFKQNDIILLDCLTTLLNNEFFHSESFNNREFQHELIYSIKEGIIQILNACDTLIIVSNEVLNDFLGESELVLTYGKLLGHLHQFITQLAEEAYLVEAGVPVKMKGEQTA